MLGVVLVAVPMAADAGSTTQVTATQDGEWHTYSGLLSGNGQVTVADHGDAAWWYDRTTGEKKRVDLAWDGSKMLAGIAATCAWPGPRQTRDPVSRLSRPLLS